MGFNISIILNLPLCMLWFFPLHIAQAFPERPVFHRLNVDNGLSQNNVRVIHQDKTGFIWLGTRDGGLNRFDGYSVKTYKHREGDSASLSDNSVYAITETRDGALWVGTNNGLNRFDPRSESFQQFFHDPAQAQSISDNRIRVIFEDREGQLWVGTKHGLNHYDPRTGRFQRFIHPGGGEHNFIKSIQEDSQRRLWLATFGAGVIRFDKKSGTFEAALTPAHLQIPALQNIWQILIDRQDRLWAATEGGLLEYETGSGQQRVFNVVNSGLTSDRIQALHLDESGVLWFGGYGGIYRGDTTAEAFQVAAVESNHLPGNIVLSLFKDKSGSVWLGTERDGALYFNLLNPFKIIRVGEHFNNVYAFYRDQQRNTWIGTANGLVKIDQPSGRIKVYQHQENVAGTLSHDVIRAIFQDTLGNLWVATENGLNRYDDVHDRFEKLDLGIRREVDSYLSVVYALDDGDGNLYIATNHGLVFWDRQQRKSHLIALSIENKLYADDWFDGLYLDTSKKLWVFGKYGFYYLDAAKKKLLPFRVQSNALFVTYSSMVEDQNGNYWVATSRGLLGIERKTGKVTIHDQGLLGQYMLYSLVYNGGDDLWLGTNGGLWRFNIKTEKLVRYTVDDGIQGNEFHSPAKYVDKDGRIYMGGINGVTVFHPQDIRRNSRPPPVVITGLIVDNNLLDIRDPASHSILKQSITLADQLIFKFGQADFFAFEFSALDYGSPASNRYAYMLEGLNRDWVYTDASKRRAVYTALPPGHYRFKVKAANAGGVWNETGATLGVTVLPPIWRTVWAYALYILLFVLSLILFIRYRTGHIKAQAGKLEQEVQLRTQEIHRQKQTIECLLGKKNLLFANVSHELRTPLTLILGPVARLLQKAQGLAGKGDLLTIQRNAQRLLRLVNQLLEFSRLTHTQAEQPIPRALSEMVGAVQASMEVLAVEKKLSFQVSCEIDIWVRATSDALESILLNLLSNSFKYTAEQGFVRLRVERISHLMVKIVVEDTGSGIPEDQYEAIFERFARLPAHAQSRIPGTGLGLALVKELVELIGGTIRVQSEVGVGSTFTVILPCCAAPGELAAPEEDLSLSHRITRWISDEARGLDETAACVATDADGLLPEPLASIEETTDERASILVIDDTEDMRHYLKSLLNPGYRVLTAVDGAAGLKLASVQVPDLIVCDIMMPGLDGFEVLEKLREDICTSHIPVILLTARGDRESRLRGLTEMADDYITKPFDADELRSRIQNLLGLRQLLKEKFGKSLLKDLYSKPQVHQSLAGKDREFLKLFKEAIEAHYRNDQFNVDDMCALLHMSERPMQRKLKALLGYTPHQYLRIFRLEKAAIALASGETDSVTGLARVVGFASQTYFSACFKAYFGTTPKEYQASAITKEKPPSTFIKARR